MEAVQKQENRTRSELLREAWRQYYERRYAVYAATRSEAAAIRKGRVEIARGEFVTLNQLHHELDSARRQGGKKKPRKVSR